MQPRALADPSDYAASGYADGFGGRHDDGVQLPHFDLVKELRSVAGEAHVVRRRPGRTTGMVVVAGQHPALCPSASRRIPRGCRVVRWMEP